MSLKALFVPDRYLLTTQPIDLPPLPLADQHDEGYSDAGAIAIDLVGFGVERKQAS